MKKLTAVLLGVVLSVSLVACGNNSDNNTESTGTENTGTEATNNAGADTMDNVFKDVPMSDLKTAVTGILGENYWPQMALDAEMLSSVCGISADMYEDFLAEMPMMSAHIDTMIIIKAKDGQVEAVEEAAEEEEPGMLGLGSEKQDVLHEV